MKYVYAQFQGWGRQTTVAHLYSVGPMQAEQFVLIYFEKPEKKPEARG